ncbi:hypothetical protein A3F02_00170 [Candidatus Curtissbacteria bacterium RIFCSPHIGHO2_12_FULL_38_9b]|uniref:Uncharacterized protein n=2 Tax=Candidatus Curtissiibacteriota TaxID=1752717 RepID=A0A1F5GV90_9BACT|nr:MAG: hypothetical protein A3A48_01325 [Candidatus Curtissbacteria bacterium RIFCSPLOWO2_01_FULL_37_9]OGD95768.1 MAG: hypothetical protein A3F02_00170 [Candidatus Curtissbacteria bacterium RIFCSPHIGHO2_12_FULL_38_9b]
MLNLLFWLPVLAIIGIIFDYYLHNFSNLAHIFYDYIYSNFINYNFSPAHVKIPLQPLNTN